MPWARFDERFPWHRKVRRISDTAFRLHVSAICWCSEHLTDGKIQTDDLGLVSDVKRPGSHAAVLVTAGLWEATDAGWLIHDYLVYNPSKAEVEEKRERDAERKRKGRTSASRQSPNGVHAESARTDDGIPAESARTVPARTEPNPIKTRKRATPPPSKLEVTDEMREWAAEHAPDVRLVVETSRMLDWARGKGESKQDWVATWRNWMGRAQDNIRPPKPGRPELPVSQAWMASNQ